MYARICLMLLSLCFVSVYAMEEETRENKQKLTIRSFTEKELTSLTEREEITNLWKWKHSDIVSKLQGDKRSCELIAEAWFFSEKYGLFDAFKKHGWNNETFISNFRPIEINIGVGQAPNDIQKSVIRVCEELILPSWSHEASYALKNAVFFYFNQG